jgi:lysophospholipase L1-like esterase/dienelactone hydrolase
MHTLRNIAVFIFLFVSLNTVAQKRFKSEVFSVIDSVSNIKYGQAVNIKGEKEELLLDVFTPPKNDTLKYRPLVIFIHGGGFQNNSKNGSYSSMLCTKLAKRGYVTATIDYRLGVEKSGIGADGKKEKTNTDYAEALYRAQQDGKAAIRFFRKNAEQYGIDTTQIFITGSSAGSKTCLAIAYMNESEVPKDIDKNKWGSLEGNSGNEGFSSKVNGVINAWGAMIDYNWIQKGDVPLFNTAGTNDKTVPFDSAFDYHGFKYGPYILFQHCLSLGIATGWRPFYGTGHTLDNNKIKQDSCVESIATWLYTQLKINKGKNEEGVFRWEKEINAFDSLNTIEKHSPEAVMFLGSSYIRLWKNIREDLNYSDIIHRGFGGCNLRDVAYYVKRIVYPHQLKAIFIYVGNDLSSNEKDKSPDQILELYKYIVKTIREKYPTIPITWLAISPSEKRWSVWDKVTETNNLIKAYSNSATDLYYIDAGSNFLGSDGKPDKTLFRDDKLHYNEAGYKLWGKAIASEVKRIASKE